MTSFQTPIRIVAASLVAATLLVLATASRSPVDGQNLAITTPYPSVSVQPGSTASFALAVTADAPERVDLSLEGLPDGWTASFRGGGTEVSSVFAAPTAPELTLDVDIPDEAEDGVTTLTVVGAAGSDRVQLPLEVAVIVEGGGTVSLTTEFPSQRGTADQTFEFSLDLDNETPQELTLGLQASGPQGWTVTVQPQGETRAASVTIAARETQQLTVSATPPADVASGSYPIRVDAVSGDQGASIDLVAEVTGRVEMAFSTADQRLNTSGTAGSVTDLEVVVTNSGTTPITGLTLSGTGPSEWEITFEPDAIEQVDPSGSASAVAHITPSQNAVAGDYVVTLRAVAEDGGASEEIDIRVTVETPPIWGIVGIALIALTIGGLVWVFQRYGRR